MKELLRDKDDCTLQKILDPSKHRAGRKRVISKEEETMIVQRLMHVANRGFPVGPAVLKSIMARIAADGRTGFPNVIPSDEAIRNFRARHREITYRAHENKDLSKRRGENYEHVKTYVDVLRHLDRDFPGMLHDGDRVWNMDETSVDIEFGQKLKAFVAANSHHGPAKVSTTVSGGGKHVTAVIAISASGLLAPPFSLPRGIIEWHNGFGRSGRAIMH